MMLNALIPAMMPQLMPVRQLGETLAQPLGLDSFVSSGLGEELGLMSRNLLQQLFSGDQPQAGAEWQPQQQFAAQGWNGAQAWQPPTAWQAPPSWAQGGNLASVQARPHTRHHHHAPLPTHPRAPQSQPQATRPHAPAPQTPSPATTQPQAHVEMTPELQKSYDRAVKRFGHIPGAEISVSASPASGGKPVVLVRHHNADPQHLDVQTHFHGFEYLDKQVHYDQRIGETVEKAWDKNPNMVFVFPEAGDEGKGLAQAQWDGIQNVHELTRHAVESAGLPWSGVEKTILSGHSAGGSPVAKALARAQHGQDGPFDRVELYDAAVQSKGTNVTAADRRDAQAYAKTHKDQMLYVPGVMASSWSEYIPHHTHGYGAHFDPLWTSLGQQRQ